MQSDRYVFSNEFPEKEISNAWDNGQQIVGMAYGQGKWVLLSSTKTKYGLQRWATNGTFPADEIKEGWDEGFDIVFLSYVNDRWVVILCKESGFIDQIWRTSSKFPDKEVKKGLSDGYKITSVSYGVDRWAVVMSKGPRFTEQSVRITSAFPENEIKEGWDAGMDVTSLAEGNGEWVLVMSANSGYETQSWATRNNFEQALVKEKAAAGNDIGLLTYASGMWNYVFTNYGSHGAGAADSASASAPSSSGNTFSKEAVELFDAGRAFSEKEQYDKAINCFRKAIKLEPDYHSAYNSLGVALDNTGELPEALECFRKAHQLDPSNPVIMGNLISQVVDNEEDLNMILEIIKKAPSATLNGISGAMPLRNIGLAYRNAGQNPKAIEYFKKALNADPEDEEARRLLDETMGMPDRSTPSTESPAAIPEEEETTEVLLQKLNKLTGLDNIKTDIDALLKFITIEKMREQRGYAVGRTTLHTVFTGPPGTGKTTVARLMGKLFKSMGLLSKGHVVEVDRAALVGEFIGSTAIKTNKVIDSALGGILFIDEAYSLTPEDAGRDYGQEAINTLVKRMEDHKNDLIVIVAGYEDEMRRFISSNPGLQHRFARYFKFSDYKPAQLTEIFKSICREKKFHITRDAEEKMTRYFEFLYNSKNKNFGNARTARNLFEEAVHLQSARLATLDINRLTDEQMQTITIDDITAAVQDEFEDKREETLDDILGELKGMVGLEDIKQNVVTLVNFIKAQQKLKAGGYEADEISLHSVFFGPPGTGKTTVARLMGRIYKSLGLLPKGHVVEVARAQLVGEYVGQTAPKTVAVLDSAMYGILFIDEAYTLASEKGGNDFGQEAIDTILKRMDDDRDKLAVIVAGYTADMQRLIATNSGLESRFNNYFYFSDYTPEELTEIFRRKVEKRKFRISPETLELVHNFFARLYNEKTESFGNGRMVRNFYEKIIKAHSNRVALIDNLLKDEMITFTNDDAEKAISMMTSIGGHGSAGGGSRSPIGFSKK